MTRRQTNAAAVLVGLSPLLHIVPGAQVQALGGAGWLGCAVALPVVLGLGALLQKRGVFDRYQDRFFQLVRRG